MEIKCKLFYPVSTVSELPWLVLPNNPGMVFQPPNLLTAYCFLVESGGGSSYHWLDDLLPGPDQKLEAKSRKPHDD
jgi:hypothetical protein